MTKADEGADEAKKTKAVETVDKAERDGKDKAEIERLAEMDDLAYMRARKEAAKKLGIDVGDLNKLVAAKRKSFGPADDGDGMAGRPVRFEEPEPFGESVDGAEVLTELATAIRSYVIISAAQVDALTLWIVFTHAFDAFDTAPKINLKSVEKRSGKSRLVTVAGRLVAKRLSISGGSAAALMRVIESHHPTILLDEIDALLKKNPELAEAIRGLLNAGFERAGSDFILNVPCPGGGYEPRLFSAWAPQLLSGIGELPDTVRDRSVTIEMRRKKREEKIRRLRRRDGSDLNELHSKVARWAADNLELLGDTIPEMPDGLDDRAADAWEPLIAIAHVAGGNWPDRARKAALALSGSREDTGDSAGTMLLSDCRAAFADKGADRISSEDLVTYLHCLEDRPWPEFKSGKPLSKAQLARALGKFGVSPETIRVATGGTPKGYYRKAFEDVFARYLPSESATPPQTNNDGHCGDFQSATPDKPVALLKVPQTNNDGHCGAVALSEGVRGERANKRGADEE